MRRGGGDEFEILLHKTYRKYIHAIGRIPRSATPLHRVGILWTYYIVADVCSCGPHASGRRRRVCIQYIPEAYIYYYNVRLYFAPDVYDETAVSVYCSNNITVPQPPGYIRRPYILEVRYCNNIISCRHDNNIITRLRVFAVYPCGAQDVLNSMMKYAVEFDRTMIFSTEVYIVVKQS